MAADGHEPAAAAWAIHEAIVGGRLIPEVRREEVEVGAREEIDPDCITERAKPYFGSHGRPRTIHIGGRMVSQPTFTGTGPVPFACLLVRTTSAFWERPNEAKGATEQKPLAELLQTLLNGPEDAELDPRDMALLGVYLAQERRRLSKLQAEAQEERETGFCQARTDRRKLSLIYNFNRRLQQTPAPTGNSTGQPGAALPKPASVAPNTDPERKGSQDSATSKRSTERGEGQAKLIAALTKHHRYADGSCLNSEPIGNNDLAKLADVSTSTASAFFKEQFHGHGKYKILCNDSGKLAMALKILNGELAPHRLLGRLAGDATATDDE